MVVQTAADREGGVLTGPRWSSAVMCPRKAVYEAQNAPRRDPTPTELRRFRRGQVWEEAVVQDVVAELKEQGRRPRRQETVQWPIADPVGTGHMDCYIPSEKTVLEVVSNAGGTLPAYKALQVAGYALNHPNAEKAYVLSVDTHTGDDPAYPIDLDALEPRIRDIEEQVVSGIRSGEPPCRVCRTPADGPAQMCAFVEHCFQGWEWPPLAELLTKASEMEALADAEDLVSERRKALARASEARDALRETLRPLIPVEETVDQKTGRPKKVAEGEAAGVRIRRSIFSKTTLSLADAQKCGVSVPDVLEPFVKTHEEERWTVKRLDP